MSTVVPSSKANAHTAMPRAASRAGGRGGAPVAGANARLLQQVLYIVGAVLLPTGLVVIVLGWYGAANTPYEYDQLSYLVSGGLLGLGLTFCGGFLYFGSWLARIATDQKEASRRLADTLLLLADTVSHSSGGRAGVRDVHSVLVVAGTGRVLHRADCDLVAGRDDLAPAAPELAAALTPCRLCRPDGRH
jgi:hypothetical protein